MEKVYSSSSEIGNAVFECGNKLNFPNSQYWVTHNSIVKNHNSRFGKISNNEIFLILGIPENEIQAFCFDQCGYFPHLDPNVPGQFPIFKENDQPAITKVIKALFEALEKK